MDPPRSFHPPSSSVNPSLICVGGMLRVADAPPPNSTLSAAPASRSTFPPPNLQYRNGDTPCRTPNITPFKALVSPFTATAPFTAPSTPYSHSAVTPIPLRLSPTQSPSNLQGNSLEAASFKLQTNTTSFNHVKTFPKEAQMTAHHLLTPKQVRELRRLCRKTANRAEFEDRLIQIRQVASIAAMASSSLHLFDPENPQSGLALRVWVETHRAEGADWRDERPLSDAVIDELRRWDRLLKTWARARFESFKACESDIRPLHLSAGSESDHMEVLHPMQLRFEHLSIGTSPTTPLGRVKHVEAGEQITAKPQAIAHMSSPTTPDDRRISFLRSHEAVVGEANVNVRKLQQVGGARGTDSGRNAMPMAQSAWRKNSPSVKNDYMKEREPLAEVCINKVGDLINVTVPTVKKQQCSSNLLRRLVNSNSCAMNASAASGEENVLGIGQMKSWRNVVLESTKSKNGIDDESTSTKHCPRYGENGCNGNRNGNAYGSVDKHSLVSTPRPDLDWSRLRGGERKNEGFESSFYSLNGNELQD